MVINAIRQGIQVLLYPGKEFRNLNERTFESVLGDYLKLLITAGILSGIFSFLISLVKAAYFDIFMTIDIQYWRMMNYSLGRTTSTIFFYLFAGTFIFFFLSVALFPFFRNMKYVNLLRIMFYSLTPFLLFSWVPILVPSLALWSIFLFIVGVKNYRKEARIKKDSIQQRD